MLGPKNITAFREGQATTQADLEQEHGRLSADSLVDIVDESMRRLESFAEIVDDAKFSSEMEGHIGTVLYDLVQKTYNELTDMAEQVQKHYGKVSIQKATYYNEHHKPLTPVGVTFIPRDSLG